MDNMFDSTFQSIRSIIVGDPSKSISGEVVQIKNTDAEGNETNKYAANTIAEVAQKTKKRYGDRF